VFYRGKGAYLVGRISSGSQVVPLAIALLNGPDGIEVDAVLLTENQVSILFSFTRSYFHVDVASPATLVHFLSTLMPRKRRAELYISIGHNKHGKTELYRELRRHIGVSGERFEMARGTPGLVMEVFTLPGFDVVFKAIKDRFGAPKQITRDHVRSRYRLVFRHDRAGRLVDAQEFEHLEFHRSRFEQELLDVLLDQCARTVSVSGDKVHLAHVYVERRVTPLDVYLAEAEPDAAEAAVIDYGQSIKDMAASGIFPGDMLLKNFGVTRHGRVVFYDYDEVTSLTDCVFRRMPPPADLDDEMAAEPWFAIGPNDVFPEEFPSFLGLKGRVREVFMVRHFDLFDATVWQQWQQRVREGEMIEIFAYDHDCRLRREVGAPG
jgi:isocitrate dehydrogenase kinase/phosphatase